MPPNTLCRPTCASVIILESPRERKDRENADVCMKFVYWCLFHDAHHQGQDDKNTFYRLEQKPSTDIRKNETEEDQQ